MVSKHIIYIFFLVGIAATSCAPNRIFHKSYNRSLMDTVYHFPSLAWVNIIEKGNHAVLNDSLSVLSGKILDSLIWNDTSIRAIRIEMDDSLVMQNCNIELLGIFNNILETGTISSLSIPPNIRQIIQAGNHRYYMASLIEGFGRKGSNYAKQIGKGIAVGILTLGLYTPVPNKSRTRLMSFIIDKHLMKIIFFSSTIPIEKSPTEIKVIKKEYQKILPPKPVRN